eukprot:SAG31_NODE_4040_length_3643_cov_3.306998_3_plen_121_part_00
MIYYEILPIETPVIEFARRVRRYAQLITTAALGEAAGYAGGGRDSDEPPQADGVQAAPPSNWRPSTLAYSGVELQPPPSIWTPISSIALIRRAEVKVGQRPLPASARRIACAGEDILKLV